MLRRGFPKRGRRFMSRKAIITGRAFAGNELPAKSPLCPERRQAFTQQSSLALRGIGPGLCLGSVGATGARPTRSPGPESAN